MIWQLAAGLAIALLGTFAVLATLAFNKSIDKKNAWALIKKWTISPVDDQEYEEFFGNGTEGYVATKNDLLDDTILDGKSPEEARLTLKRVAAMRNADAFIAELLESENDVPMSLLTLREEIDEVRATDKPRIRTLVVALNAEVRLTRLGIGKTGNPVI